jgi:hypothetical protein
MGPCVRKDDERDEFAMQTYTSIVTMLCCCSLAHFGL